MRPLFIDDITEKDVYIKKDKLIDTSLNAVGQTYGVYLNISNTGKSYNDVLLIDGYNSYVDAEKDLKVIIDTFNILDNNDIFKSLFVPYVHACDKYERSVWGYTEEDRFCHRYFVKGLERAVIMAIPSIMRTELQKNSSYTLFKMPYNV